MAKGGSKFAAQEREGQEIAGDTDGPGLSLVDAKRRVLGIQTKLTVGRLAMRVAGSMICTTSSPIPRFFWSRGIGCGNRGARTAGVDGETAYYIREVGGEASSCAIAG